MIPQVFTILKANAVVVALLGSDPLRVFPWDEAPQESADPYCTYTIVNGDPQNTFEKAPVVDLISTQVDVWAPTGASCEEVAVAVRNALEAHGHMTSFSQMQKEANTSLYRLRMDFDLFTFR